MGEPQHSRRLRYLSTVILYFIIKMEQALYELENQVLPHLEDVNLETVSYTHLRAHETLR